MACSLVASLFGVPALVQLILVELVLMELPLGLVHFLGLVPLLVVPLGLRLVLRIVRTWEIHGAPAR